MLFIAALKYLILRMSLLVTGGSFINLVRSNEFLESLHDQASLNLIDGKCGEWIDTDPFQVSESLRLCRNGRHQMSLTDPRKDQVLQSLLGLEANIFSPFLICRRSDPVQFLQGSLDHIGLVVVLVDLSVAELFNGVGLSAILPFFNCGTHGYRCLVIC